MKYFIALLIIVGTLAAIRWLAAQMRRIEFDHHADAALDMVSESDWTLWEQQVSA